jgi:hypothetical protein
MANWHQSMQQTFEYYLLNTNTWQIAEQLKDVISCDIDRDDSSTLGGASIDSTTLTSESYVRIFLKTIQNGVKERHTLGTFIVQTPSTKFDGKVTNSSMDAYTPLLELKENPPPLGYSIRSGENVMTIASRLCRENMRAPIVETISPIVLTNDFVADTDDTWLSFITDLIAYAGYEFLLDEYGRVMFSPKQDIASLQPVWTYTDDNSSILEPTINLERDLYGIPNVVEVIMSTGAGHRYAKVENNDPNSPTSTVNRGRKITHRITDPDIPGTPTQAQIDEYATLTLRNMSALEYTLTYSHAYCPVRVGDCVRLNYTRAGLNNIKAKVTKQTIKCVPGCPVEETATFTTNLWR